MIVFIDIPARNKAIPDMGIGTLRGILNNDGIESRTINPLNFYNLKVDNSQSFPLKETEFLPRYLYPTNRNEMIISDMFLHDFESMLFVFPSHHDIELYGDISELLRCIQSIINYTNLGNDNELEDVINIDDILSKIGHNIKDADAVGFHTTLNNYISVSLLSMYIRKLNPYIKIIFGGPNMYNEYMCAEMLRRGYCDITASGFAKQIQVIYKTHYGERGKKLGVYKTMVEIVDSHFYPRKAFSDETEAVKSFENIVNMLKNVTSVEEIFSIIENIYNEWDAQSNII